MNNPTSLPHLYHGIIQQIDDDITNLQLNSGSLTEQHKNKLQDLVSKSNSEHRFTVSEVDKQFELVTKLRDMVINDRGGMLTGASVKDVSSLISSMNSLISLFMKSKKEMDAVKENALLKDAVLQAIGDLGLEEQNKFFEVLNG